MEITYTRKGDVLIPNLVAEKIKATYGKLRTDEERVSERT